jgi:hypothetical protein
MGIQPMGFVTLGFAHHGVCECECEGGNVLTSRPRVGGGGGGRGPSSLEINASTSLRLFELHAAINMLILQD